MTSIHDKYGISGHHACSQEQYRNDAMRRGMSPTGTVRMLLTANVVVLGIGAIDGDDRKESVRDVI